MYYLIYASAAAKLFTNAQLIDLLAKSRENNSRRDISGMLLYKDGSFLQVLEGAKDSVETVYKAIASDPRHHGISLIYGGQADHRQFPDWTMGFRNLDSAEVRSMAGYSDFLQTSLTSKEFMTNPDICKRLLHMFKATM